MIIFNGRYVKDFWGYVLKSVIVIKEVVGFCELKVWLESFLGIGNGVQYLFSVGLVFGNKGVVLDRIRFIFFDSDVLGWFGCGGKVRLCFGEEEQFRLIRVQGQYYGMVGISLFILVRIQMYGVLNCRLRIKVLGSYFFYFFFKQGNDMIKVRFQEVQFGIW